jgi:alkyl hydroperoxide reductase subunit F
MVTRMDLRKIKVDSHSRTAVEGIYAAGDCTNTPYKKIGTAVGAGTNAALAAFEDRMRATA